VVRWRYTHVPLAAVSVLLLLGAIVGLVIHRVGGWDPPWHFGPPAPGVVALAPSGSEGTGAPSVRARPPTLTAERRSTPMDPAAATAPFVLESGPFASPDVADRTEEQLNRLGHPTVRFRHQDSTRLYVVSLTGFAGRDEALEAARQAGRGSVVDGPEGPEVVVAQLPSLGEAVAAARPFRARGIDVRVTEALAPIVVYHLRYGRFERRGEAQALREQLAREGIPSQVVGVPVPVVRAR
jgi:cell division protein FtsN